MSQEIPPKIVELAWKINTWCLKPRIWDAVDELVWRWYKIFRARRRFFSVVSDLRDSHALSAWNIPEWQVKATDLQPFDPTNEQRWHPRLPQAELKYLDLQRFKVVGEPPFDGWVPHLITAPPNDELDRIIAIVCWTPPELTDIWDLEPSLPLPPSDKEPNLVGKAAAIAAVQARCCDGVNKLLPPKRLIRERTTYADLLENAPIEELRLSVNDVSERHHNTLCAWFDKVRDEVEALVSDSSAGKVITEPTIDGYRSADYLFAEHGIRSSRLSEAASAGKVRTMPAPKGMQDSELHEVRKLYNEADALKHCQPKRVTKKTREKLGRSGS